MDILQKVLLSVVLREIFYKAILLLSALFPKGQETYVRRNLEATTSKFSQNIGHSPQMEVNLLASVVFCSYKVLKLSANSQFYASICSSNVKTIIITICILIS